MSISLLLRYWDRSLSQYRTLDLQCSVGTTLETPAPVTPTLPVTPTTAKVNISPPAVPKLKVHCSSDEMIVELPSGLISGISVKGVLMFMHVVVYAHCCYQLCMSLMLKCLLEGLPRLHLGLLACHIESYNFAL